MRAFGLLALITTLIAAPALAAPTVGSPISGYPSAVGLDGTEVVIGNQAGITKQIRTALIAALVPPVNSSVINPLIPFPGASQLGGLYAATCGTHVFAYGVTTGGLLQCSQPSTADITGLGALATLNVGNGLTSSGGNLLCTTATTIQLGCVEPDGTIITVSGGVITVPKATASVFGVVEPDGSSITASGGVLTAHAPAASITVGSTVVGSGTSGSLLYNNAGVVGNVAPSALTTTGTGFSSAASLASRAAVTANVQLDFGAACDGVTDDTSKFASAFAAATTVIIPAATCYSATGIVQPAGHNLKGTFFSANAPPDTGASTILCPSSVNCLTVGNGLSNSSTTIESVVVKGSGAPSSNSTGIYVNGGYNVVLHNVDVVNFDYLYHLLGINATGAGISAFLDHDFGGQAAIAYLWLDTWPEVHVVGGRYGENGNSDYAAAEFILVSGGNSGTNGGPNTGYITNAFFDQGGSNVVTNLIKYASLGSGGIPAIDGTDWSINQIHVENITTLIASDSTWNQIDRFRVTNSLLNANGACLALNVATAPTDWLIANNNIFCTNFTLAPNSTAGPIRGLSVIGNSFGGTGTISLTGPTGVASNAAFQGNTFYGNVTVAGNWNPITLMGDQYIGTTLTTSGLSGGSTAQVWESNQSSIQPSAVTFPGGASVGTALATSGNLYVNNTVASAARNIFYQTSGLDRWQVAANATAETGSNAGSDFQIARYGDAGSVIDSPLFIQRSSGNITLGDSLILAGITGSTQCLQASSTGQVSGTGSTCGGGSGSPGGSSSNVQYNTGSGFGGSGGFVYDGTSKITLGVAGTSVGKVALQNATSGSITLQAPTGALGAVTATVPANTGTVAETNLGQTWSAAQAFNTGDLGLSNSGGGLTTLAGASSASNFTATFPAATDTVAELGASQSFTGVNHFPSSGLVFNGSGTGSNTVVTANSSSSSFVDTIPAVTDTFTMNAATQTLTNKSIAATQLTGTVAAANGGAGTITGALKANGAGTVSQAAASDLSNGVTGTGAVVLAAAPAMTDPAANGAAATFRHLYLDTSASCRWAWQADNAAESGSNAGSNLELVACNDAGSANLNPITVNRASGIVTFPNAFLVPHTTFASLPGCGAPTEGLMYIVTDANAPTWHSILSGGSTTVTGALCNGSNWIAF